MANEIYREILKEKKIPMWFLAKQLGISEPTITRWFREDFDTERSTLIWDAIEKAELKLKDMKEVENAKK